MDIILEMDIITGTTTIIDSDTSTSKVREEGFKMDTITSGSVVPGIQVLTIIILSIHTAMATVIITTTTIIMAQITA